MWAVQYSLTGSPNLAVHLDLDMQMGRASHWKSTAVIIMVQLKAGLFQ